MKKLPFAALALAFALLLTLCACGGQAPVSPTADMADLQKTLLAADDTLPEMLSITSEVEDAQHLFTYLSDLPYDKVDSFLLSYSAEGKADEIAVIAVKDPTDTIEALASLQNHLDSRLALFRQYTPEEAKRAEQAIVFAQDRYAVLLISDGNQQVQAALDTYLNAQ